jgi:hypothetical protein
MKHYSRFSPDYSPEGIAQESSPSEPDLRFALSLAQTREQLAQALMDLGRYRAGFDLLLEGMVLIAEGHALPPIQKRTAEGYLRTLKRNFPELMED